VFPAHGHRDRLCLRKALRTISIITQPPVTVPDCSVGSPTRLARLRFRGPCEGWGRLFGRGAKKGFSPIVRCAVARQGQAFSLAPKERVTVFWPARLRVGITRLGLLRRLLSGILGCVPAACCKVTVCSTGLPVKRRVDRQVMAPARNLEVGQRAARYFLLLEHRQLLLLAGGSFLPAAESRTVSRPAAAAAQ